MIKTEPYNATANCLRWHSWPVRWSATKHWPQKRQMWIKPQHCPECGNKWVSISGHPLKKPKGKRNYGSSVNTYKGKFLYRD